MRVSVFQLVSSEGCCGAATYQLVDCVRANGVDDVQHRLQDEHDQQEGRHGGGRSVLRRCRARSLRGALRRTLVRHTEFRSVVLVVCAWGATPSLLDRCRPRLLPQI